MERSSRQFCGLLAFCAILAVHVAVSSAVDITGGDRGLSYFTVSSECEGFGIGECLLVGEEEEDMAPESSRRVLATRQYISYGALRRNSIPCSRRGSSYYNCRRGAQANPYSRSCGKITRCRR
ncbi:protein RALF-like 33 [Punica granatum]|uniref:Uncharacterized protein n=2 Tax=Punica granatum TaxID=22663 RepID=A0A218WN92_PUNGR|nr:protein RALF-like 33 [Punica granatum]OWM74083.1 hypothetical protein CDL15_Pgr008394 [Punica granatum]PKI39649.1 hypothetical protein CRG98_039976 [Punica granatum]